MGVTVSKTAAISEFSFATGVIGVISFAFTLATFVRVVWVNVSTLGEAPHQVHGYLTNLRTELLEEKASLKNMRKGRRKHLRACRNENRDDMSGMELDEVSLRTMNDSVRSLIKRFRDLEKPFLEPGEAGIGDAANHRTRARRRNSSVSPPYYTHAAYSSPPEKRTRARSNHAREQTDDEADEEAYWAQRTKYARFTLIQRFRWLKSKAEAQYLFETLSRVQIRRIALQVGGLTVAMHTYGTETVDLRDSVRRIDERVSRIVPGRRGE